MDTKLRKSSNHQIGKVIAFLLCIVFFMATLVGGMATILTLNQTGEFYSMDPFDVLSSEDYMKSNVLELDFYHKSTELVNNLYSLKSEDYINNGNAIDQEEFDQKKEQLFYETCQNKYDERYYSDKYNAPVAETEAGLFVINYENSSSKAIFEKEYAEEIKDLRKKMILDDLRKYREDLSLLNESKGFTYYATDGTYILTNLKEKSSVNSKNIERVFKENPAYLIYKNEEYTSSPKPMQKQLYWEKELENFFQSKYDGNLTVYMAYDKGYVEEQSQLFQQRKADLIRAAGIILTSFLLSVALFVYLLLVTGRRSEQGIVILGKIDRWFTEIQIGIIIAAAVLGVIFVDDVFWHYNPLKYYGNFYSPELIFFCFGALVLAITGLFFVLSLVRKIKAKRFLSDFACVRICQTVFYTFKQLYYGSNTIRKVALIVIVMCVCSASIVLLPVVLIFALLFSVKVVKQYEAVKKGVDEVRNGNLTYKILINGSGKWEFERLAKDINDISEGFDVAVKQELKNQRLKTELISNVSHDIKTPLTSIITYVDLLKKEGLDCEDASKYLDVLDQKSIRLKKLTEDLFEAAKASSGDMPVNIQEVELLSLIHQGLGEMNDGLDARGLDVIIKAEKEKYCVLADGKLLWRVVENLFGNIIKYAQENSRIYIDLREELNVGGKGNVAVLEIKNVSQNPLNIPAEELMERFIRGDKARNTDGSGLGLSIARDLMQLQKGTFDIVVDGDLFKAILGLEMRSD